MTENREGGREEETKRSEWMLEETARSSTFRHRPRAIIPSECNLTSISRYCAKTSPWNGRRWKWRKGRRMEEEAVGTVPSSSGGERRIRNRETDAPLTK